MTYRPFAREPFTQGIPRGTALLLRKLRGDQLDWAAIEQKLIRTQACLICKKIGDKNKFHASEFKRGNYLHNHLGTSFARVLEVYP